MKRAGFTMIELIFVIVILGILSAVALPKFIGVSNQAKAGKCKAYVGTLNRTVLPAIWSNALLDNATNANINSYFSDGNVSDQITAPKDCNVSVQTILSNGSQTVTVGGKDYNISRETNASLNSSPILKFN